MPCSGKRNSSRGVWPDRAHAPHLERVDHRIFGASVEQVEVGGVLRARKRELRPLQKMASLGLRACEVGKAHVEAETRASRCDSTIDLSTNTRSEWSWPDERAGSTGPVETSLPAECDESLSSEKAGPGDAQVHPSMPALYS